MSAIDESASRPDGTSRTPVPPGAFDIDWWTMLMDPGFLTDPYPDLKRIRELAPVHYDPVSGIYFVLGHDAFTGMAKTATMGRDTQYWATGWNSPVNRKKDPETYDLFVEFQPQMINANPPDHRRMRGVYERAYRPGEMNTHLPLIQAECERLLADLPRDEPFDFMTRFANPLPHRISLRMFDIDDEMDAPIARWIAALSWLGNIVMSPEQKREAQQAQLAFKAFVRGHLERMRADPGQGLVSLALAAADDGTMNEEETVNNVVMLISGSRTTLTLLGNGLYCLLRNPDQFTRLRANRGLMRTAIEEMLRFEAGSSIIPRAAIKDYQCGDVRIPAGALAIGLVGAVNRDPAAFDDPDVFDLARKPNAHRAFGGGPHICIGKALARLTAHVAFNALMDRFERIELAGEPEWWTDRSDQRGLNRLPIRLIPA